jgi:hypothetical protein
MLSGAAVLDLNVWVPSKHFNKPCYLFIEDMIINRGIYMQVKVHPKLVQDVQLMILELGNITVLWEEQWLSTLQDLHAGRIYCQCSSVLDFL